VEFAARRDTGRRDVVRRRRQTPSCMAVGNGM
jgi:hypothetical protein